MLAALRNLLNIYRFWLRNKIALKRPVKNIPDEDKTNLFDEETTYDANRLSNQYNLSSFYSNSTVTNYKENLYILKLLEDAFANINTEWNKQDLKILDTGSRNFSYATALYHFFSYYKNPEQARSIALDGIEVDPFRIMSDLHSRYDYAQYYIRNLPNTRYLTADFLKYTERNYDFITWFLPFIVKEPLIKWGIPLKYLKPEEMLLHALKLLKPGGIILLVNQLDKEKNIQLKIIRQLGLNYSVVDKPYSNNFSPYSLERYITLIKKD